MTNNSTDKTALLRSVVDHILPPINGIGGLYCGVPEYIEQWLTSEYGIASSSLIEWGLQCIQDEHESRHGKVFYLGDIEQRLLVLTSLEELDHHHYQIFWRKLIHLCLEGFLSHPRHGGNKSAKGWESLGYPGKLDIDVQLSVNVPA